MTKQKAVPCTKKKAHIQYIENKIVYPGVTTFTGQLNKPALVYWAWGLGMKQINLRSYVDEKASIGTLAHYMILCYYKELLPVMDEFSKIEIDKAENAMLSFYEWEKTFNPALDCKPSELKTIRVEKPEVSSYWKFGGTSDYVGETPKGKKWMIDYKTGKDVYVEAYYQVAGGYSLLEAEKYSKVDGVIILNIGRNEDEQFAEKVIKNEEEIELWQKGFLSLVDFHYNYKKIKKLRRL